ncbi:hypothetical protein EMCRGX_G012562 [Ephydatia muelleri]
MGCSSIVDPRSAPTTTTVPAATDSIYTTTPNVVLRPGDPLTVSVNVVSLPNAPLDLYILMDLSDSMAAPLATVKSISQLIAQQVSSITTNVRIGFGAFNDKPIYPYSPQTPAGCLPGRDAPDCSDRRAGTRQYSFLHLVNFTSNFTVPNVFVTTNLDLPESSFDALVQVLACEQELVWRNRSVEGPERGLQRLVLLITDNQPHLAGDGCDYPSVGLVASLLKKYDVIPIFGIVPITSSTLLINNTFLSSYQEVIQNIAITLPTQSDVAVSLSQITCPRAAMHHAVGGLVGESALSLTLLNQPWRGGVFPGEQLVVIITPSFISMRFPMVLWTLKWKQTSDVLCCTVKPLNQHVTHDPGGTLRASTLTNHVKPMTASWCGTPGRTQGKPALPWSQVGQRGGPTTHHDHVMVVARLVASKASQRYLGPRFGLMGTPCHQVAA